MELHSHMLLGDIDQLSARLSKGRRIGSYSLQSSVGIGSMGIVFAVENLENKKPYALKALIAPHDTNVQELTMRFNVHASLLLGIEHSSVTPIWDIGRYEDICYLIMPLITGPDIHPVNLADYANWFGGKIVPEELLDIYDILLSAFTHYHTRRIIHGNLKPQNILLQCLGKDDQHWQAKIMVSDFGLSRILGADYLVESVRQSVRTHDVRASAAHAEPLPPDARALLQTYDYMSPEQRQGKGSSRGSDVFSLGLMFLHLLTGKKAIGFQPPSRICSGIDAEWDNFILKSTAQDRKERFRNVAEMHQALKDLKVRK